MIKEDSNYRQYYCNDHDFFLKVINKEVQGPYHFKLNVFVSNKNRDESGQGSSLIIEPEQKARIFDFIKSLNAIDV